MSMRLVVVSLVVAAGCAQEDVELAETTAAVTPVGGQGTDYNGTDYNGTDYNGTDYNGTDYNGVAYGGVTLTDNVTLTGTELMIWRRVGFNWEQRFPDHTCTWNSTKSTLLSCTGVVSPSPLTGTTFTAHFVDSTGATVTGTLQITGAARDTTMAMHPLNGASSQPTIGYGLVNSYNADDGVCDNPYGCRVNKDIWLYTIKLWNPTTSTYVDFCRTGASATALAGTWDQTGQHSDPHPSRFTFACTTGTITKCTRWGYRPYASARKSSCTTRCVDPAISLADFHQACVRAAAADYCANKHSFTQNGTIVDISDDSGFIPRMRGGVLPYIAATAVVWESTFDKRGGVSIDHQRYQELASPPINDSIDNACPGTFQHTSDDFAGCTSTSGSCEVRDPTTWAPPYLYVDSAPTCSHSELIVGKWLGKGCSTCTGNVALPSYCTNPTDSRGWDIGCVQAATTSCTASSRMAVHNECTTSSAPLQRYDSGCTLAVCLPSATSYCCDSTRSWDAGCTAAAESKCKFAKNASNAGSSLLGYCTWAATHGGISP